VLATVAGECLSHFRDLLTIELSRDDAALAAATISVEPIAAKGDLPRFTGRIAGDASRPDGATVVFRFSLHAETIWDEDFATIMAATVEIDHPEWIETVALGLGDDKGLAHYAVRDGAALVFVSTAWRFRVSPSNPFLQVALVTRATATPIVVTMSRLFAGHDYDPYIFNPRYAAIAVRQGRPNLDDHAHLLADFEREARSCRQGGAYFGA
jgi:hypothetical protein